jgi:hypothetical protein
MSPNSYTDQRRLTSLTDLSWHANMTVRDSRRPFKQFRRWLFFTSSQACKSTCFAGCCWESTEGFHPRYITFHRKVSAVTVRMRVCGGLGNRLLQYAAGLALARRHQARLIIDASFYCTKSHRSFQLNQLELDYELSHGDEKSVRELSSTPTGELVSGGTQFHAEPRQYIDICFSECTFIHCLV